MKRNFVKAGLAHLSVVKKIALGNSVAAGLDGNPLIPGATTIQTSVATATQNLSDARDTATSGATAGSIVAEQAMLVAEVAYDVVMNDAILFVQGVADDASTSELSKEIILSSGFGVRKTPESSPVPNPVAWIKAMYSPNPGEISLKWKNSKYARFYRLYMSTDNSTWTEVTAIPKRKFLVTGLDSLTRYYFAVVAVGTAGASHPSNPVSQVTA